MYYVKGWDRKTDDTVILYEHDYREAAVHWAKKYTKYGDMGGWDKISVYYHNQVDITWEGEPIIEEVSVWSCWSEPMRWCDNAYEEF